MAFTPESYKNFLEGSKALESQFGPDYLSKDIRETMGGAKEAPKVKPAVASNPEGTVRQFGSHYAGTSEDNPTGFVQEGAENPRGWDPDFGDFNLYNLTDTLPNGQTVQQYVDQLKAYPWANVEFSSSPSNKSWLTPATGLGAVLGAGALANFAGLAGAGGAAGTGGAGAGTSLSAADLASTWAPEIGLGGEATTTFGGAAGLGEGAAGAAPFGAAEGLGGPASLPSFTGPQTTVAPPFGNPLEQIPATAQLPQISGPQTTTAPPFGNPIDQIPATTQLPPISGPQTTVAPPFGNPLSFVEEAAQRLGLNPESFAKSGLQSAATQGVSQVASQGGEQSSMPALPGSSGGASGPGAPPDTDEEIRKRMINRSTSGSDWSQGVDTAMNAGLSGAQGLQKAGTGVMDVLNKLGIYGPEGIGRNALPLAGLVGAQLMRPDTNQVQGDLKQAGARTANAADQLLNKGLSGTPSAGAAYDIDQWLKGQQAQIAQRYANMGRDPTNDSSAQRELADAGAQAVAMKDKAAQSLIAQGLQAAGLAQGPEIQAAIAGAGEDKEFSNSIAELFQALALSQAGQQGRPG